MPWFNAADKIRDKKWKFRVSSEEGNEKRGLPTHADLHALHTYFQEQHVQHEANTPNRRRWHRAKQQQQQRLPTREQQQQRI